MIPNWLAALATVSAFVVGIAIGVLSTLARIGERIARLEEQVKALRAVLTPSPLFPSRSGGSL